MRTGAETSFFGSFIPDKEAVRTGSGFLVWSNAGTDWLLGFLFVVGTDILSCKPDFGSTKRFFSDADWAEGDLGFLSAVLVRLPCRKVRDTKGLLGGAQSGCARAALSVRK